MRGHLIVLCCGEERLNRSQSSKSLSHTNPKAFWWGPNEAF